MLLHDPLGVYPVGRGIPKRPASNSQDKIELEQRADTPLGFGKHKFMTYGEMVRDDPHYCAFIAELQDVRDDLVHGASNKCGKYPFVMPQKSYAEGGKKLGFVLPIF